MALPAGADEATGLVHATFVKFVTQEQLGQALAALRCEMRHEMLAALEAERLGSSRPPSPKASGSGSPEPTADRAAEAPPGEGGGEQVEPAGQGEQVLPSKRCLQGCEGFQEEFAIKESIWDAAMLIGGSQLGLFGSIFTCGAVLMNAAMQILMCLIINDNLTRPAVSEDDIAQLDFWRTTVAHNIKFVDQFSWKSLAEKVCSFEFAPMSASPIQFLDLINEYRPRAADRQFFEDPPLQYWAAELLGQNVGFVLCCIALSIWWMTVLQEGYDIVDTAMAIVLLPKGSTVFSMTNGGCKWEAVSNSRRCLIGVTILMRACICVLLLISGRLYLAATVSLSDLILNAVALEIVMGLDELVFSVAAPASVRKLIRSMEPLPAGRSMAFRGLDFKSAFALLFWVVGTVYVVTVHLQPQAVKLERARDAICDGNQAFVAGIDRTGMVFASDPQYDLVEPSSLYTWRAMRHLIENEEAADQGMDATGVWLAANWRHGISEGHWSVSNMVDIPIELASELLNPGCQDADSPYFEYSSKRSYDMRYRGFWRIAKLILEDAPRLQASISSCEDVADVCSYEAVEGTRARQYCPVTCGCNDPTSVLANPSEKYGCPRTCRASDLYRANLGELRCADWAAEDPQTMNGTDVLSVYLSDKITNKLENRANISEALFRSTLSRGGCPALADLLQEGGLGDLCDESNPNGLKPITFLCPETCRCAQSGALLCPPACGLVA